MTEPKTIVIDAGHGGPEPGAVYEGRQEKNDNLRLALAVGNILEQSGVNVVYTRVNDVYNTPLEKAQIANRSGADYFLSIHRNAMPIPGSASGTEVLVYENEGIPALLAENISRSLAAAGFQDLGVKERPELIVLRRTQMPAVLVEAGFLDNEADNQFFDQNFQRIAQAIAQGVQETIEEEKAQQPEYYQIQVGAYQDRTRAEELLNRLRNAGFPAFLIYRDGLYLVRAGAFENMDNAARMERRLRSQGYSTWMVLEPAVY